eukprot:CAMPEP_0174759680 /NCGR_PEP_ID=MMETSP1094-20130205/108389_1 /TAXON_ID=156173 /ORGANISM="Chrysochromulina brevifilum, Strain UTEX LB 985" /LENGTH=192 /DNA_ID=CAMNT_0015965617 /DNA_START=784 /DNA_END=1359 /DNA_ORIENTATION=+
MEPGARSQAGTTVFLLGWTGCHPKHLQKYAEAWALTLPSASTALEYEHCQFGVSEAWTTAKFDHVAEGVLQRMLTAATRDKLIVHAFSNGGGYLWAALSQRIQSRSSPLHFAALVFDSCPGSFRSLSSGAAFLWESQRWVNCHASRISQPFASSPYFLPFRFALPQLVSSARGHCDVLASPAADVCARLRGH